MSVLADQQTSDPSPPPPTPTSPAVGEGCQEVRLAVVMYGGVSLAIYMNGIARELFHLVRATATGGEDRLGPGDRRPLVEPGNLRGTEAVYRELGQRLCRVGPPLARELGPREPVMTSFVIDVLSGTSAGGLNAVFLAKALANGQSMAPLRDLWLEEGDIHFLINDAKSVARTEGLVEQVHPRSLLNADRMHLRLREALERMDLSANRLPEARPERSPYVAELDLFVTTTDIHGVWAPIRLADKVAWERRHRNVFHFRLSESLPRNDFDATSDPCRNEFLTFASRATSAFPFAFEPMTLKQIGRTARTADGVGRWEAFFRDCLEPARTEAEAVRFSTGSGLAFGDGGILDNRPFGLAIDAIEQRMGAPWVPVDRKLIFVEPLPEIPKPTPDAPPNAIEHVAAALVGLPRYETIREDLERLVRRNRAVERVGRVLGEIGRDMRVQAEAQRTGGRPSLPLVPKFEEVDLEAVVRRLGVDYAAYHRLKVAVLTDDLAAFAAAATGIDQESDEFRAVRELIGAWRFENFLPYLPPPEAKHGGSAPASDKTESVVKNHRSENGFLVAYDLPFRLRRLRFVKRKTTELWRMDGAAKQVLWEALCDPALPEKGAARDATLEFLTDFHHELGLLSINLRMTRARLLRRESNPLSAALRDSGITRVALQEILGASTEEDRAVAALRILDASRAPIERAAAIVEREIADASTQAKQRCEMLLERKNTGDPPAVLELKKCLWHYYLYFVLYDQIQYPILYHAGLGEERDEIEVIRVSPLDATSLVNESPVVPGLEEALAPTADEAPRDGRRKLAGTALGNFGGFLERRWRHNDIVWGRLDGAERLIRMALPGPKVADLRRALTEKAQLAILEEEFGGEARDRVARLMADAIAREKPGDESEEVLLDLVRRREGSPVSDTFGSTLAAAAGNEALLEFFRQGYEVNRSADPRAALRAMARATRVTGRLLESIAEGGDAKTASRWFARAANAFWGLVEVAVPDSFANHVLRNTLKLLYAFEIMTIVLGTLLLHPGAQQFGAFALVATLAFHVLTMVFEDIMRGKKWFPRFLAITAILLVAGYAAYGFGIGVLHWEGPWASAMVGLAPLYTFAGLVALIAMGRLLAWSWEKSWRRVKRIRTKGRRVPASG
jgi:patatin-related protein